MPQTQHVKAAEILYDPPVLTSSWNSRTAPKPDGIPRRGAAGPKAHDSLKNDQIRVCGRSRFRSADP
jgi:hypothetical protein